MNKKTLAALKKSIRHWEDNLKKAKAGMAFSFDGSDCDLCASHPRCVGCPVKDRSGQTGCHGTPWEGIKGHYCSFKHKCDFGHVITHPCQTCVELVQKELDFLKSLLPKRKCLTRSQ
jgi:hypothetical protein